MTAGGMPGIVNNDPAQHPGHQRGRGISCAPSLFGTAGSILPASPSRRCAQEDAVAGRRAGCARPYSGPLASPAYQHRGLTHLRCPEVQPALLAASGG